MIIYGRCSQTATWTATHYTALDRQPQEIVMERTNILY